MTTIVSSTNNHINSSYVSSAYIHIHVLLPYESSIPNLVNNKQYLLRNININIYRAAVVVVVVV